MVKIATKWRCSNHLKTLAELPTILFYSPMMLPGEANTNRGMMW